jgi:aminobenzoyl-glutamate utilization protein B
MDKLKENLFTLIDSYRDRLVTAADAIYDHPEWEGHEVFASDLLTNMLEKAGFTVERGLADLPTSFRATWQNGEGGPSIGMLCEYDALKNFGHGCGHHLQGPACIGAALALREVLKDKNFKIVIYGTPAEETFGGKINMIEAGCFKDIDVALMMHGGPATQTDIKSLALSELLVIFHGKAAHAAIAPDQGRSAFDALLIAFNGIEFLREHVRDDVRMHYTVEELPGPNNVVPDKAVGSFCLRSYSREELDGVVERVRDIMMGAALIAGVTVEIKNKPSFDDKIPALALNDCIMANAKACGAPGIEGPREKTGSTDFGNVLHRMPGACARIKFVPAGSSAHSQVYLDNGKSESGHAAILYGAKILAGTAADLITNPELLAEVKQEFQDRISGKRK